jgi:GT2 family glycosyltransferase
MNERPVVEASLIIASRNRKQMLRETVASVLAGTVLPAELIVVDQSDEADGQLRSLADASRCTLRYLWTRTVGLSRANNAAVEAARSDLLVFTHDDVRVEPDWLETFVRTLKARGERVVLTGRVLAGGDRPGGFAPALSRDPEPAEFRGIRGLGKLRPLNMAMHRRTLEEVGAFDPRLGPGTPFPGAEDSDLGYRLLRSGCTVVYVPEAVVYHRAWRPERDYLPLRWGYGVAQGAFYAKNVRGDRALAWHIARDVARRARRFPVRVVREPRRALADPLFLIGNVVGAVRWVRMVRRSNVQP